MAATTTACRFSPALHCRSFSTTDSHRPIHSNLFSNTYKPFSASKTYPSITLSRPSSKNSAPKRAYKSSVISGLGNRSSETHPESESSVSNSDATIDIKLPRRSLLVQFTCELCGERTQKLVNRLAYERGLIYVQLDSPPPRWVHFAHGLLLFLYQDVMHLLVRLSHWLLEALPCVEEILSDSG
ncbi:uncharacterized protein LOC133777970 isoform X3 [Humulus lupulus]|uniref:uncharacterized protein LOC133777970 isoform X3 n=1 Tax=Humulus lupulus TaxID=3486 RepID=UPI002B403F33|nr:uncharacterized protein LOC133777970 isoform X3 [Humulus lupulus]XP_062073735.1 uncharacterized protein LOC133777970 isoform X3 [Humulus lupulus]XP_062073736.1 uncharacterized protein LOC133777970 isoform X3 [Humulus lupulus]XP_062073737.1 uncharacterized protein LOC133777970 isoform X3 [Humulus lupulus]XP_062073738.1 uncharacterized protein LOC133777970 isoform X3 [Humulus lupulus]XP_062073739.1 uncharacterized protein LOC133777970 isoform X3 [Humulus lupulus]